MLSIAVLIVLLFFLHKRSKARKHSKLLSLSKLIVFNALVVELFVYVILLCWIYRGGNFFLIDNQILLDKFFKSHLTALIHSQDSAKYSPFRLDNKLGYSIGENKYFYQYKITNSQGLRADREYSLLPSKHKLRFAAFGDSFVHCDGEITQNCWTYMLEKSSENLEILNFGVSGYGLGQSYLRYLKDGVKFNPDIIYLNYVLFGNRDRINPKEILFGDNLTRAHYYRVQFSVVDGVLVSRSMTPMDLFNETFRNEFIYKPLGISEDETFLSSKVFSFFNTGILIKTMAFPRLLKSKVKEPDASHHLKLNYLVLKNLFELAEKNKSFILFFYPDAFSELPYVVQGLIKQYSHRVEYVKYDDLLKKEISRSALNITDLKNSSNHYNPKGNKIFAQIVARVL